MKLEVLCDFDGTITAFDTVDHLLNTLADPAWEAIEAEWEAGKISSRECMTRQVPLIRGGWKAIQNELDQISMADGFQDFIEWCRQRNIPVSVVSDGLDRVIEYLLVKNNIKVGKIHANHLVEDADGSLRLEPSKGPRLLNCQSGVCKCQIAGNVSTLVSKVVIGDGRSDFCWAKEADILFAKSKLIDFCRKENLTFNPFASFKEIQASLTDYLSGDAAAVSINMPAKVTILPTTTVPALKI